jgi:platelet-activating factor acetylhydrolase
MSAYLKSLSLTPSFPPYTGPYKVGSIDVEIPVSALSSPSPAPVGAENIHTILFRIWYPCVDDAAETPITWLPKPQREHVAAYSRFLGAGNRLANFIS